ncbi:hypothetical protein BDK51DRAFT_38566 [Blyttiomyces helicus]|uniref:Peroxidase n=1 Tax=Blyttiomyces helicus TaxID=388810 RepID=A0A4P9W9Q4_9FUNG|nr:hypothetical protein BDK51DRAFT_38566 [Blyttiomyces helicus]|eukprot:RKO89289.1 hypothetical protein BDK51DRAFT_38566 [Blyttiomyces helicus]
MAHEFFPGFQTDANTTIFIADAINLAAIGVISAYGGTQLPFNSGLIQSGLDPAGLIPLPSDPVNITVQNMTRMGFDDQQIVAIVTGSHALGGVHAANHPHLTSLEFDAFDDTPGVFDNDIFKQTLKGNCKIPFDCLLAQNEPFKCIPLDESMAARSAREPGHVGPDSARRLIVLAPYLGFDERKRADPRPSVDPGIIERRGSVEGAQTARGFAALMMRLGQRCPDGLPVKSGTLVLGERELGGERGDEHRSTQSLAIGSGRGQESLLSNLAVTTALASSSCPFDENPTTETFESTLLKPHPEHEPAGGGEVAGSPIFYLQPSVCIQPQPRPRGNIDVYVRVIRLGLLLLFQLSEVVSIGFDVALEAGRNFQPPLGSDPALSFQQAYLSIPASRMDHFLALPLSPPLGFRSATNTTRAPSSRSCLRLQVCRGETCGCSGVIWAALLAALASFGGFLAFVDATGTIRNILLRVRLRPPVISCPPSPRHQLLPHPLRGICDPLDP